MELTVTKREEKLGKLRRDSKIPCIIYGAKEPAEQIAIDRTEYEAILRGLEEGQILTTKFSLKIGKKTVKAIIKDIQYHRTTYNILHIDFLRLSDDIQVKIKVPIRFKGAADCEGVKQGGVLKQPIRAVRVQCFPKDIPNEMYLDVSDIKLLHNKSLSSVKIPEKVKPLLSLNEVIAVVAKR
jgi:large subunit ribosomal protein L25